MRDEWNAWIWTWTWTREYSNNDYNYEAEVVEREKEKERSFAYIRVHGGVDSWIQINKREWEFLLLARWVAGCVGGEEYLFNVECHVVAAFDVLSWLTLAEWWI